MVHDTKPDTDISVHTSTVTFTELNMQQTNETGSGCWVRSGVDWAVFHFNRNLSLNLSQTTRTCLVQPDSNQKSVLHLSFNINLNLKPQHTTTPVRLTV